MKYFCLLLVLNVNTIIFGKLPIKLTIKNNVQLVKKFIKKIKRKKFMIKKWENSKNNNKNK